MTANQLAAQFHEQGLSGDYISRSRADYLFSLASQSGQTEIAGQKTAKGTFGEFTWKLVYDRGRPLFLVNHV